MWDRRTKHQYTCRICAWSDKTSLGISRDVKPGDELVGKSIKWTQAFFKICNIPPLILHLYFNIKLFLHMFQPKYTLKDTGSRCNHRLICHIVLRGKTFDDNFKGTVIKQTCCGIVQGHPLYTIWDTDLQLLMRCPQDGRIIIMLGGDVRKDQ